MAGDWSRAEALGATGLTWLLGLQCEPLVRVQAQHPAALLHVFCRVFGPDQYHVPSSKAKGAATGSTEGSGGNDPWRGDRTTQEGSPDLREASPESRLCDIKLDQPDVLEVCGTSDPLVGDHGCQEGPCLGRGAGKGPWDLRLLLQLRAGDLLKEVQGEGGG